MIVIWRGFGLPIMMAGLFVTGIISIQFDWVYLTNHSWPRLLAFGTGGALVYLLAWLRENKAGRRDSMYWIPMKVWAVILLAIGIGWAFLPAPSTEVAAKAYPESIKITTVNGMRLQGIFYGVNGHSTAVINNTTVSVGDKVGGFTVSAIEPQLVTLQAANGKVTVLKLSELSR